MSEEKHLRIAKSLGFCNGVRRALEVVETLLEEGVSPLYVLHEIVHNNFVVAELKKRGVIFVDDPAEVPPGETLVFSAHGAPLKALLAARSRQLRVEDATCPLVRKVQEAAARADARHERIVLFGHRGHPEVEGIIGHATSGGIEVAENPEDLKLLAPDDGRKMCILSQTTLNAGDVAFMTEALKKRYADVYCGAGICYATRDRQKAVRELAHQVECVLILGSPKSSNSNRLREAAEQEGVRAFLADSPDELPEAEFRQIRELGLSAGASVPEDLISRTEKRLNEWGFLTVS